MAGGVASGRQRCPATKTSCSAASGRLADHIVLLRDKDGALTGLAHRPLHPAMAQRRALGRSARRAAAGLCDRARRSGIERAGERPSLSGVGALRARRAGADLRRAGAADVVALGRHADRRLCQRARRAVQSARHDFLRNRRRRAVAGGDPRRRRAAVRFPDRPSQPGRGPAVAAAIDRAALAAGSARVETRCARRR